jgi:hypothetical protein
MEKDQENIISDSTDISENFGGELLKNVSDHRKLVIKKVIMAALGSVPWVGSVLSTTLSIHDGIKQSKVNDLHKQWLEEHQKRMQELAKTLLDLVSRFDDFGDSINERLESEEYLKLVRKGFKTWDNSDTQEKRNLVRKLLSNAGATTLCPDDLIRLFIDWIEIYHEAHFNVIREIYKNPSCTRFQIWANIHGKIPREDSAEADLFKLLIHDLSMGHVIRQHRETTYDGQFLKQRRSKSSGGSTMKSAFDDNEPYELTELGRQFVHYTMDDVVPQIS